MKKRILMAVTVAICAVFLTGFVVSEAMAFDISFDGFCDGMNLNFDKTTFMVGGMQTGCVSGRVVGNIALDLTNPPFTKPGVGFNCAAVDQNFGGADLYMLNFTTKQWALWRSVDGAVPTMLNQGTFSFGAADTQAAGPATGE